MKKYQNNYHPSIKKDTKIGNDIWISYQTTIMLDIKIGNSVVMVGQSVVSKDVPPYTIVGGNPAKEIRKRFDGRSLKNYLKLLDGIGL